MRFVRMSASSFLGPRAQWTANDEPTTIKKIYADQFVSTNIPYQWRLQWHTATVIHLWCDFEQKNPLNKHYFVWKAHIRKVIKPTVTEFRVARNYPNS